MSSQKIEEPITPETVEVVVTTIIIILIQQQTLMKNKVKNKIYTMN